MKKKYKNPTMEIMQLETLQMLALSKGNEYQGNEPKLAPRHGNGSYNEYDQQDDEDDDEEW